MKLLKAIIITLGVLIFIFFLFILISTMFDYRPDKITRLRQNTAADSIDIYKEYEILTWNIGYAGLDKNMDFFYDGGKKVRTTKPQLTKNLQHIGDFIQQNDTLDFILIQEIDRSSRRSYKINELEELKSKLNRFDYFFGKNYDVSFVPVPVFNPLGKVLSGIATFAAYSPSEALRYSFPGNYTWPKSLFMLDRCFVVCRFPTDNGKEFILINTHNSAYDDGSLRKMQMDYLRDFLVNEYNAGNYILVGGDWNQCPPGFKPGFTNQPWDTLNLSFIPDDYLPANWTWAFDPSAPSNRRVVTQYEEGRTPVTVIDFFLLSPNLNLYGIRTIDLKFENSDHNPVIITFKFSEQ